MSREALSYVVPLRWDADRGLDELSAYLRRVAARAEVIVVDGSPSQNFERHAERLAGVARHMRPHDDLHFAFGKVDNVTTGVREASHEFVVLADDDVRYDAETLGHVAELLRSADLVRPQNYFDPLPWHARWDTARTLLNRAMGGDYPGTLAVRRSHFLEMGGYDGDVLFENLELMRTVAATGGTVHTALGLYVRRVPPSAGHFLSQRVRQAYDDFALPWRMACWLCIVPGLAIARAQRAGKPVLAAALGLIGLAELGRRRSAGSRFFPASSSLLAPAWALERGICAWLAVLNRIRRGGQPYGDAFIVRSATPARELADRRRPRPRSAP